MDGLVRGRRGPLCYHAFGCSGHRSSNGDLVIHPIRQARGEALLEVLAGFDDDSADLLEQDRRDQAAIQEREPVSIPLQVP
jgi:hypothetical protein